MPAIAIGTSSALLFPVASSSPSLVLPTCPTSCLLATSLPTSSKDRPVAGSLLKMLLLLPCPSPSVGGVLHCCSMGHFARLGYLLPPPPVAVHRPAMTPTVPCVMQPCIAFFRPPVPSDPPRKASAVDHHMCKPFLSALPLFCIQEHPVPTVVKYPQGCRLPRLCVCSWGSHHHPPRPGGLYSVGPLC